MGLPVLLEEICRLILEIYKSLKDMNVEIGAEAALFPEKEYINGIAVAVWARPWQCEWTCLIVDEWEVMPSGKG